MRYNFAIVLFSFFFASQLNAQKIGDAQIHKIGVNKFEFEGKSYAFLGLESVLMEHPLSLDNFRKANMLNNASHVLGVVAISELLVGYILYDQPVEDCHFICLDGERLVGFFLIPVGALTGTLGIILRGLNVKFKNRTINSFNKFKTLNDIGKISERPFLGWSNNGVGLVLNF